MTRWIAVLVFASLLAGCSESSSGGDCSSVSIPASCPTTTPSYATDVAPILQTYCVNCHSAGGQEPNKLLDTQASVAALSNDVANEVAGCSMPPADDAQPTAAQRQLILDWLTCGAPNN